MPLQAKIQAKEQAKQDAEKAELDKQTAIAQGEANKAQAEADANHMINGSITENLIRMKEAEARLEHGWVTVQGADAVIAGE